MATTTREEVCVNAFGGIDDDDDQSLPPSSSSINVRITLFAREIYVSSDGGLRGKNSNIIGEISSQYPSHSITYDLLSRMVGRMKIPFPLENMLWKGTRRDRDSEELEKVDDLIHHVLDDARDIANTCYASGKNLCYLDTEIFKTVYLPRHEIEAINRAMEKEERVLKLDGFVSRLIRENRDLAFNSLMIFIRLQVKNTAPKEGEFLDNKYERKLELRLWKRAMREYYGGHTSVPVPASSSSVQADCDI